MWCGVDPGGIKAFGIAVLHKTGKVETFTTSSVQEALEYINSKTIGVGIDAPLWWSTKPGGGRKVDQWLRKRYQIRSGTVQSVNSLRGAAIAQGLLFADLARKKNDNVQITESHPKALLKALYGNIETQFLEMAWKKFQIEFKIDSKPTNEHERDAVIAAVCAREGFSRNWENDLSKYRWAEEQNPEKFWAGPIRYFWPDAIEYE